MRELLHLHGATDEEIDQAVADDVLDLFVFDRVLVPSRKRYTRREVAELTGREPRDARAVLARPGLSQRE